MHPASSISERSEDLQIVRQSRRWPPYHNVNTAIFSEGDYVQEKVTEVYAVNISRKRTVETNSIF